MKQKIVISFDKDEHLPILIDFAHNLKEENIFLCDSELLVNMPNYNVIHKKILINENEMHIFLTNSARNFIRGFLYFKDNKFKTRTQRIVDTN